MPIVRTPRGRRTLPALVAAAAMAMALVAAPPAHAANRAFSQRFTVNTRGDITWASNTLVTCNPALVANCASRQNRVIAAGNPSSAVWIDIDTDGSTFNSSRANLDVPIGAEVLFAGLYWGGVPTVGTSEATFGSVKLSTPANDGYHAITSTQNDITTGAPGLRQGFADVTALVQSAGPGNYTIADVHVAAGPVSGSYPQGYMGGWTLVTAYGDPTEPWRNLSVFDGLVNFNNTAVNINLSGFKTPPAPAPVNAEIGIMGYDGDGGANSARLDPNTGPLLTDELNTGNTAFMKGVISRGGVDVGDRLPNYANQLGYDAKLIKIPNPVTNVSAFPNDVTSGIVRLTTSGDGVIAGLFTTAIETFAPEMTGTKSVENLTNPGGPNLVGDTLEYTVTFTNGSAPGVDNAADVVVTDAIPVGTTYVPGSLTMVSGEPGPAGARTDGAGDDSAEYDVGTNSVVFRIGTGADATNGGILAAAESATMTFRVTAEIDGVPEVVNQAVAFAHAVALDEDFSVATNEVTTPIELPPVVGVSMVQPWTLAAGALMTGAVGLLAVRRRRLAA